MTTNVAIACQGGGSHTAFTAGVLRTLVPWLDDHDATLVGLSGTSGGAVSALGAWYGYLDGGSDRAVETLDALWDDIAAGSAYESWLNDWVVLAMQAHHGAPPTPSLSPYTNPFTSAGEREFRALLERHVDFDRIPELASPDAPQLVVGAVDVNAGEFETFADENVTCEAILASSAVPSMFRAVEIGGHYHWDGLLSQNPPIYDLMHTDPDRKPDELWVVQINPQHYEGEPTTLDEIVDRRNELAGNISLNQELRFVETVNEWLDRGDLSADRYSHTEIRRLTLDEVLSYASKLDRSPDLIERLTARGIDTAEAFLDDLELGSHEHDAQVHSSHHAVDRPDDHDYL